MKILFVITTYNQSFYTKLCLESLMLIDNLNIDILVIDDCSTDGTKNICKNFNIKFLGKDKPCGLTDSWNIGYQYFKKNKYDILILSNNDILLPKYSLYEMISISIESPIICPLSNRKGIGNRKWQSVHEYYPFSKQFVDDQSNYQLVQKQIYDLNENRLNELSPIRMKKFSGFFFLMNKEIEKFEYSKDFLFDPSKINVGNEDELNDRVLKGGSYSLLCKKAFVYHFKGVSFMGDLDDERNDLSRYHDID